MKTVKNPISTDKDTKVRETYYSARAFLAGLGAKLKALDIFAPIAQGVTIAQKKVIDTPIEKLYDAFISMLCGAKGIVEVNKLVRSDQDFVLEGRRQMADGRRVFLQTYPEGVQASPFKAEGVWSEFKL